MRHLLAALHAMRAAAVGVIVAALLLTGAASAQEAKKPADPIIEEVGQSLSPEGIRERQLRAIKALADAYEREKARADAAEAKLTAQPKAE